MAFLSFSFLPVNFYISIKIFLQIFKRNVKQFCGLIWLSWGLDSFLGSLMWLHQIVVGTDITWRLDGAGCPRWPTLMLAVDAVSWVLSWDCGREYLDTAPHGLFSQCGVWDLGVSVSWWGVPRHPSRSYKVSYDLDLKVPGYHFCYMIRFLVMLKVYNFRIWVHCPLPLNQIQVWETEQRPAGPGHRGGCASCQRCENMMHASS